MNCGFAVFKPNGVNGSRKSLAGQIWPLFFLLPVSNLCCDPKIRWVCSHVQETGLSSFLPSFKLLSFAIFIIRDIKIKQSKMLHFYT